MEGRGDTKVEDKGNDDKSIFAGMTILE